MEGHYDEIIIQLLQSGMKKYEECIHVTFLIKTIHKSRTTPLCSIETKIAHLQTPQFFQKVLHHSDTSTSSTVME